MKNDDTTRTTEDMLRITTLMADTERLTEVLFRQTGKTAEELLESKEQGVESPAFHVMWNAILLNELVEAGTVSDGEMEALWNAVKADDIESMKDAVKLEYGHCPHSDQPLQTIVMNNKVHRVMVGG